MTGRPDPYAHDDAAYVLGALPHERRLAYEQHLRTCAQCSAAVADLAGVPGLLARLPAVPEAPAPPLPDTVLPGLVAGVRRTRRRRRAWGAAAGVAAAAALVAGTAVVTSDPARDDGVPVELEPVADVPVQADLRLTDVAWGTRVTMECRYDGPAGGRYATPVSYALVVVSAADRSTQTVARWQALPGRDAHVAGSTDLSPDQIAGVQLRTADGTVLLEGTP